MNGRRAVGVLGSLALAVVLFASCSGPGLTRAGVPTPPIVLDVIMADAPGRFTDEVIAAFGERVEQESSGELALRLNRVPNEPRRPNQQAAEAVMDGSVALGVVPANAWDAFDTAALSALSVPFAVTTDALIDAVAQDQVAADMLAELGPLGVTGLALVPGGVRMAVGTQGPLIDPDSYRGARVRVAYSRAIWAYYEALGARPDDPSGAELAQLLESGDVVGLDLMFRIADAFLDAPAVAADTVAHPHALTIVGNTSLLAALSKAQRKALDRAAAQTVTWSVHERAATVDEAAQLCDRAPGAVVVLAGPERVAALRRAVQPMVDALLSDPVVAGFAARIAEIDARLGHPALDVRPCVGPTLDAAGAAPPNSPVEFPDGLYRRKISATALMTAGVDRSSAAEHEGVWELEFEDGVATIGGCSNSSYTIVDGRLAVTLGDASDDCGDAVGDVLFSAGWFLDRDQLTFTSVESGVGSDLLVRAVFGGGPWSRLR